VQDPQDQGFSRRLVSAAPDNEVTKAIAVFIVRTLLMQLQGYKAHKRIECRSISLTRSPYRMCSADLKTCAEERPAGN
jgi:hypothetical protein